MASPKINSITTQLTNMLKKSERIAVSIHFYLDEFIPEVIWNQYGKKAIIFVRKAQIVRAEALRKIYGATIINSWAFQPNGLNWCGFRTPDCPTGAELSQHKMKSAEDYHFTQFNGKGIAAYDQVRDDIIKSPAKFLEIGITTIEAGTWSWLHADDRLTTGIVPEGKIYVVPYR